MHPLLTLVILSIPVIPVAHPNFSPFNTHHIAGFCYILRQWAPQPGTNIKILPLICIYHLLISLNTPLFQCPKTWSHQSIFSRLFIIFLPLLKPKVTLRKEKNKNKRKEEKDFPGNSSDKNWSYFTVWPCCSLQLLQTKPVWRWAVRTETQVWCTGTGRAGAREQRNGGTDWGFAHGHQHQQHPQDQQHHSWEFAWIWGSDRQTLRHFTIAAPVQPLFPEREGPTAQPCSDAHNLCFHQHNGKWQK